jgi:hypothetical protein
MATENTATSTPATTSSPEAVAATPAKQANPKPTSAKKAVRKAATKTASKTASKTTRKAPVKAKSVTAKKPVTKTTAQAPAKPSPKAKPTAKPTAKPDTKPAAEAKAKKPKLVRDSFTFPKEEYQAIAALKQKALGLKHSAKKSEILRAGIKLLSSLNDKAFLAALSNVPALKTGRPAKD